MMRAVSSAEEKTMFELISSQNLTRENENITFSKCYNPNNHLIIHIYNYNLCILRWLESNQGGAQRSALTRRRGKASNSSPSVACLLCSPCL